MGGWDTTTFVDKCHKFPKFQKSKTPKIPKFQNFKFSNFQKFHIFKFCKSQMCECISKQQSNFQNCKIQFHPKFKAMSLPDIHTFYDPTPPPPLTSLLHTKA